MTAIYRGYDQAALEREYTVGRPELNALRDAREARVTAANADVAEHHPSLRDCAYGNHPRERIDYYPTEDRFAPLVAFFHGGYWRSRSKDMFGWLAPAFTRAGINFAAIGYPLAPEFSLPDIVASCQRAIHWLQSYPSGLRFDPSRMHVVGHSAGAHLAAMMVVSDWTVHGLPENTVRGAVCISGLYDLEPVALCRHVPAIRLTQEDVAALSPIRKSPPRGTQLVACAGSEETSEFRRQTESFADAWEKRGASVTRKAAPGMHHFNVLDVLAKTGTALNRAAMARIKSA